ncbi:CheR family methyltransferase [Oceanobacillus saliphilus]|uniref:CheR family methyltransferase n=1 Tax=Oceanobacillus saliphilus TaxID=2925834 RepID=UPI00201D8306|nr:protein-glutamate O-methyltransferase CheR [Oceanobacillus saliphilus]
MKDDYIEFIQRVKKKIGIDLNLYKETQMKRRITTLRDKRGFSSYLSYFEALCKDEPLLKEFTDRLTINVSEFYRNPKRWDVLKSQIIPMLLETNRELSIWSAACSTGEEPYSLAIMAKEHFPNARIQILATDIDDNVLAKAKQGTYLEKALKELPDSLKKKYFTQTGSFFQVEEFLKKNITFKKHNLLSDRYPSKIDLIVCRNVLIYFTDQAKEEIYQKFSKSLKSNGILFVGSTEQIFNPFKYSFHLAETFFYQKVEN